MRTEMADVVVLGMGPGGEEVAAQLAVAGLTVVGVERELVGGECPYWGCVPSKMLIRGANLLAEARRVDGVSGHADVFPDFGPVAHRIRAEATDSWDDRVAVERFLGKGGHFIRGSGRLDGPRRLVVDTAEGPVGVEAARAVVIATGTRPVIPPIPGLAGTPYWTNRHLLQQTAAPESLVVLGGGAIGCEFAQGLARFGSRVTIVEGASRVIPLEEPEAAAVVAERLGADGIDVHLGVRATAVAHEAGTGFSVTMDSGETVTGAHLLVATGRRAHLGDLGLETAGISGAGPWLEVDEHMRAGDGVYGVGDICGKGAFTHIAIYQARICVDAILGRPNPGADYRGSSRVTFTDPEVGAVGLTEAQAREQGLRVLTGTAQVPRSSRGWIHGPGNDGVIKLVMDADRGVLVGATSAGPVGGEVLSMLTVAVSAEVSVDRLRRMIYAYPTFHRGIEDALAGLAQ